MNSQQKPKTSFWIIAVIALLWNLFGVLQVLSATIWVDQLAESYPAELLSLMNELPSWYHIVFAIAVGAGVLGSLLLLLRKKLAMPVFGISLIALLIQMGYWLFATNVIEISGPLDAMLMPVIVIAFGIFIYYYSKGAAQKGWLR